MRKSPFSLYLNTSLIYILGFHKKCNNLCDDIIWISAWRSVTWHLKSLKTSSWIQIRIHIHHLELNRSFRQQLVTVLIIQFCCILGSRVLQFYFDSVSYLCKRWLSRTCGTELLGTAFISDWFCYNRDRSEYNRDRSGFTKTAFSSGPILTN